MSKKNGLAYFSLRYFPFLLLFFSQKRIPLIFILIPLTFFPYRKGRAIKDQIGMSGQASTPLLLLTAPLTIYLSPFSQIKKYCQKECSTLVQEAANVSPLLSPKGLTASSSLFRMITYQKMPSPSILVKLTPCIPFQRMLIFMDFFSFVLESFFSFF